MHISLGRPLISAEQEPHFPALQFQRTARSGACSAWILWTASRTTIPSPASTTYSLSYPPPPHPPHPPPPPPPRPPPLLVEAPSSTEDPQASLLGHVTPLP